MPRLNLERREWFEVEIRVPNRNPVGSCGIEQKCVIHLLAVVALHSEAGALDGEGVGGRAIALVKDVVSVEIAYGLNLKLTVWTLQEKVLAIPSCRQRRRVGLLLTGTAGGYGPCPGRAGFVRRRGSRFRQSVDCRFQHLNLLPLQDYFFPQIL